MLSFDYYPITPILAACAVALDAVLGEPRRWHPLVGFGNMAHAVEARLNREQRRAYPSHRGNGILALALLILPLSALAAWLCALPRFGFLADVLLLYFAIGHKSLHQHACAVADALKTGNEARAKMAASYMVSRDPEAVEPVPATIESVLENGNDSVFGALFWFFIAGGAGALAFRLVNTLDAMWGYKNERFLYFGWAAARLDDVLNYLPARLTAVTYALLGKTRLAIACWRSQAPVWKSPNAGPVMAAGAGALAVRLGGLARYHGQWQERPVLGAGDVPKAEDIGRALKLVRNGVGLWIGLALLAGWLLHA